MTDEQHVGAFNPTSTKPDGVKPPAVVPEVDAIDNIRGYFEKKLNLSGDATEQDDKVDEKDGEQVVKLTASAATKEGTGDDSIEPRLLKTVDMRGLVERWKAGGFKRIVTMVGAGISTSAGIPDFRSPGTGLYHNLKAYNLPHPMAIFSIDYFVHKPRPFFALAKELYPGQFRPTPCHYFIRLLHEHGLLHRHYTQNIDTLDRIAGIPADKLVEAHGTFHTNHCVDCRLEHAFDWMKERVMDERLPLCESCGGLVKPDIVFFGENLPKRFYELPEADFGECDLLIVMGTSLTVHPFAGLVDLAGDRCVRLLINREVVGDGETTEEGFQFGRETNGRDVLWEGDCDEGVLWLAEELGLKAELEELMRVELDKLDGAAALVEEKSETEENDDALLEKSKLKKDEEH